MAKPPIEFEAESWLSDPQLSKCSPATRGIWIDAIANMSLNGRTGVISGTPDQLVRSLRCTGSALISTINELQATGAADVILRYKNPLIEKSEEVTLANAGDNVIITLINRRMHREAKARELNRKRQNRFKKKLAGNASITEQVTEKSRLQGESIYTYKEFVFKELYKYYPRHENPTKAQQAFKKAQITENMLPELTAWIERAKQSEQWSDKSKIPYLSTWINQRRWLGDPPPPPMEKNGKSSANSGQVSISNQPRHTPKPRELF